MVVETIRLIPDNITPINSIHSDRVSGLFLPCFLFFTRRGISETICLLISYNLVYYTTLVYAKSNL
jgi:hypothetical protein